MKITEAKRMNRRPERRAGGTGERVVREPGARNYTGANRIAEEARVRVRVARHSGSLAKRGCPGDPPAANEVSCKAGRVR